MVRASCPKLEKRIASLALLITLLLLQRYMQGPLVFEDTSKSLRQQQPRQQRHDLHRQEFLEELFQHEHHAKTVQESSRSSINTTTTAAAAANQNNQRKYIHHSFEERTRILPTLLKDQRYEGDYNSSNNMKTRMVHKNNSTKTWLQHEGDNHTIDHSIINTTNKTWLQHEGDNHTIDHSIINTTNNLSDPFLQQMLLDENRQGMQLSSRHQQKFISHKSSLQKACPASSLYESKTGRWAAVGLNLDWAYIHIWKSGGTTIEKQTGRGQRGLHDPTIRNRRHWMSLVRDPIDHFLSGWAECGMRSKRGRPWHNIVKEYDGRIREHLNETRTMARILSTSGHQVWTVPVTLFRKQTFCSINMAKCMTNSKLLAICVRLCMFSNL
jgi:hypothetical protein